MQKSKRVVMAAWVAAPIFGVLAAGSAAAAPEVCNWKTARDAANSGDYTTMCDCTHVTPSFLQRLQNRSDFSTTLQNTGAMCPGLASLLTDVPTASIGTAAGSSRGEDRGSDQFAQVSPADPGDNGSSGPGNGGGNPGDGGNDGPGNGGGDGPGDGGDGPGDGGDGPGDGGGGNGPGKGGDGPGKGGGKGGDGPGKGRGKGGHGGGKGGDGKGGGKGGGKGKR